METNVADRLVYYVCIPKAIINELHGLRHWSHLKLAEFEEELWLTGFEEKDMVLPLVLKLSNKTCYYETDGYLFYLDSRMPVRQLPNKLCWNGLKDVLKLQKPRFNMNYFGLSEEIVLKLKPGQSVRPIQALWTTVEALIPVMEWIPDFRIRQIQWTLFNENQVILFTTMPLPVEGTGFWNLGSLFIPLGFELEYNFLNDFIQSENEELLFIKDSHSIYINPISIKPLTRAGFRLTTKYITL